VISFQSSQRVLISLLNPCLSHSNFLFSPMASSKPKMSPQEISELVQNLQSMGQLEDVMREARLGVPVVTGESMNDSSKRRLFAEDEEDAEFEYIPADGYEGPTWRKRQQPIMPKPTGGSSAAEALTGSHARDGVVIG
jgi:hypothetical protein